MNNKVIWTMMVLFGAILVMWGYDTFNSPEVRASRLLGESLPINVWVGFIVGSINIFVGLRKLKQLKQ